ncbi:MAG: hypothetical protein RJA70_2344 [Pseudomonadota bacterium]|jgi:hypothetical protein
MTEELDALLHTGGRRERHAVPATASPRVRWGELARTCALGVRNFA